MTNTLTKHGDAVPVATSFAAGILVSVIQLSWDYVANTAVLQMSTRKAWKTVFLAAGIAVLVLVSAWVAVDSRDRWVRRLTGTVVIMMGVAWLVPIVALFSIRGGLGGNSVLINEPLWVRLLGGVLALVMYIVLALGPALLVGWLARTAAARARG